MIENRVQHIGVIPISAKPFTSGHQCLIEYAARNEDLVILFVSNIDRIRKKQYPIRFAQMQEIWNKYVIPNLPKNVVVNFVQVPVAAIYAFVGVDSTNNPNRYMIYSDDIDAKANFPRDKMEKYFSDLYPDRLNVMKIQRSSNLTIDISGTQMRQFLMNWDFVSFSKYLPTYMQPYTEEIWKILRS